MAKRWVIATTNSAWDIIPEAEHIERNCKASLPDDYDDFDAAKTASKAGVKLIHDIEGIYKGFYVDTPENRTIIADYMAKHPDEVGHALVGEMSA